MGMMQVPRWIIYLIMIGTVAALVPPTLVWRLRTMKSEKPRIHLVQDMDNQARFKTQQPNPLFADNRASRPVIEGTVARGELRADDHFQLGVVDGGWAETYPDEIEVDMALLMRGQERFGIFCSMCHGSSGYGDGMVHQRAMELVNNPAIGNGTQWVQPRSLHEAEVREQSVGQIYNTITNGIRNMAGYEAQIPIRDRWAITAYVKALQRSQHARPADLDGRDPASLELRDLTPPAEDEGEGGS